MILGSKWRVIPAAAIAGFVLVAGCSPLAEDDRRLLLETRAIAEQALQDAAAAKAAAERAAADARNAAEAAKAGQASIQASAQAAQVAAADAKAANERLERIYQRSLRSRQ